MTKLSWLSHSKISTFDEQLENTTSIAADGVKNKGCSSVLLVRLHRGIFGFMGLRFHQEVSERYYLGKEFSWTKK
jgi:hypothetical protein